jgi:hypothetical protein
MILYESNNQLRRNSCSAAMNITGNRLAGMKFENLQEKITSSSSTSA